MGQRQIVDIPIAQGLHQKTAEPWLDPTSQITCQNAIWIKQNAFDKRLGYLSAVKTTLFPFQTGSIFAWAPTTLTASPALLPSQKGYAVTDGVYLYAGSASANSNAFLDYIPPCVGTRKQVGTSPNGVTNPTVAEWSGGIRVYAWEDNQNTQNPIYYAFVDTKTNEVIQTGQMGQTGAFGNLVLGNQPQVIIMGTWAVCFFSTGASAIGYSTVDLSNLASTSTWTSPTTLVNNNQMRGWDVSLGFTSGTTTTAALSYVFSATAPTIKTLLLTKTNASPTVSIATSLTNSTETGVSILGMGVRYNGAADRVWLAYAVKQTGGSPTLIRALSMTAAWSGTAFTSFTLESGPITLTSGSGAFLFTDWVGVEDVTHSGTPEACILFSDATTVGWAVIDNAGNKLVGANVALAMQLLSKPFAVADPNGWVRCYAMVCDTTNQQTQYLSEFDINQRGALVARPCASVAPRISNAGTGGPILRGSLTLSGVTNYNNHSGAFTCAGTLTQTANVPANLTTIGVTFDFNHPGRFCSAQLGGLTYTGGGLPSVFDGMKVVESSTLIGSQCPTVFSASSTGGQLTNGQTYSYVIVPEWRDLQGNVHQGQPSLPIQIAVPGSSGATGSVTGAVTMMNLTRKNSIPGVTSCSSMYLVPYRTAFLNGAMGTTYFRLVGDDPGTSYVNDPTALTLSISDAESDANAGSHEVLYTTGGVLENDAPSSFADITAHSERLYGIGDDLRTIWISTAQVDGIPCTFNDTCQAEVTELGDLTALWSMDANLYVASADGLGYYSGAGPNTTGTQSDLSPFTIVPSDVGCVDPRAVCVTPIGTVFRTRYGLALLDRNLQVHSEFGDPVIDWLNEFPTTPAIVLHPTRPEIHVYVSIPGTVGCVLVYNYRYQAWSQHLLFDPDSIFSLATPGSAVSSGGSLYVCNEQGRVWREKTATDSLPYYDSHDGTSNWVKLAAQLGYAKPGGTVQGQGYCHGLEIAFLVQDWSALTFTMSYDFADNWQSPGSSWQFTSAQISAFPDVNGSSGRESRILLKPKQTWCGAFSFGFFDAQPSGSPFAISGQSVRLISVSTEIEATPGNYRVGTAQRG